MIPIKNKKKTLEITIDEMTNFALNYIEKFAPSKQQLKIYLLKKYLNSKTPNIKKNDISDLIDIVIEDLEKSKFINDKFYSESKAKSLIQRGSSINKIRNYLFNKGVGEKYIKNTIEKMYDVEVTSIRTLNYGGVALSAGGVIFATGTSDGYVYALNSKNGELLWEYKMNAAGSSPPILYEVDGNQYMSVISTGGAYNEYKDKDSVIYTFAIDEK